MYGPFANSWGLWDSNTLLFFAQKTLFGSFWLFLALFWKILALGGREVAFFFSFFFTRYIRNCLFISAITLHFISNIKIQKMFGPFANSWGLWDSNTLLFFAQKTHQRRYNSVVILNKNPSIYNIKRWVAWTMGQTNRRPRVWCSKYNFFSWFLASFKQPSVL